MVGLCIVLHRDGCNGLFSRWHSDSTEISAGMKWRKNVIKEKLMILIGMLKLNKCTNIADLSNAKAFHDLNAFIHPSFRTHTGKTEAERSVERASRALSQLKNAIYGICERSESINNSINKR